MSTFDQRAANEETKQQQQKGPEAFLSPDERKQLKRLLSKPEEFPREFGSWIAEYIAVNGLEIPVSQIRGFNQFQARSARITGGYQGTASTAYGNLATAGPELTGLGDGQWIFWFGADIEQDYDARAYMAISVNGASATDTDSCHMGIDGTASGGTDIRGSITTAVFKTLDNGGNNTVTAKYRAAVGSCNFDNRWIIGLRVGN